MKSLVYVACALVVLAAMAVPASAADNHLSTSTLNAVGLSGFAPMSDAQAMTVRGKYAAVGGITVANSPGAYSSNSYTASGHHSAVGGAFSLAVSGAGGAIGPFSGFVVVGSVAAGGAFAAAH